MREITQKIYKFNELSKEIQEKLIEKEKQFQIDSYCNHFLLEDMEEKARELLQKYFNQNATFKNVCYSLAYNQGDGAMIEFELIYYNKPVTIRHAGHYYHERSFQICSYELTDKQHKQLKEKVYKINCEIAKFGYDAIENCCPDEEIVILLEDNEYFENGELY